MTGAPQKDYIITEEGMSELDKYFIGHKDRLIKIAWKNLKDKHVRSQFTTSAGEVLDLDDFCICDIVQYVQNDKEGDEISGCRGVTCNYCGKWNAELQQQRVERERG